MANPQPENGLTSIAHEIIEHLAKVKLASNQWQILMVIFRKTYGWHKKSDYITNSQIIEATGLCKSVVSRALHALEVDSMIIRTGRNIGFQKDWERWGKLAELSTKVSRTANNDENDSTPKVSSLANPEKLAELSTKLANQQPKLAELSTKVSSPLDTQSVKVLIQKKLYKEYGEFHNVLLTDEEFEKLKTTFKEKLNGKIEKMSCYLASSGKKYKSHYATFLVWERRDQGVQAAMPKFTQHSPRRGNGMQTVEEMRASARALGITGGCEDGN